MSGPVVILKWALAVLGFIGLVTGPIADSLSLVQAGVAAQVFRYSVVAFVIFLVVQLLQTQGPLSGFFLVLRSQDVLTLETPDGKVARYRWSSNAVPVRRGIAERLWNVDVTGTHDPPSVTVNGKPVQTDVVSRRGTRTEYRVRFPGMLDVFRRYEFAAETVLRDTYTAETERFSWEVRQPTLAGEIRVQFPGTRACASADLYRERAGILQHLGPVQVSAEPGTGGVAAERVWYPRVGDRFWIYWTW